MAFRFYTKTAIGLSTVFLTPFFGSILFSYNLKEVGKGKLVPYFIAGSIAWVTFFHLLTAGFVYLPFLSFITSNIFGSVLLTFWLWDRFFDFYHHYKVRSVWRPVLVYIGICAALLGMQWMANRGGR